MIKKIIAIAGLPGSGKTELGKLLAQELDGELIDDPGRTGLVVFEKVTKEILVVTDPLFCFLETRQHAEKLFRELGAETIEWIFFAPDIEQCLKNAALRPYQKVNNDIKYFAARYNIPSGIPVRPVYKP